MDPSCECFAVRSGSIMIGHSTKYILTKGQSVERIRTLQWRHNERDGASNDRRLDCLINRLNRRRSKKTSELRVTGLCEGNLPVTLSYSNMTWHTPRAIQWKQKVAILTTFSSLVAPEVVRMTTSGAASDENRCTSYPFSVTNGVRQGGVLSPILFNVYVDE